MANRQRGEIKIKLGGKTYVMRPTFEALCEIEDTLNMSLIELSSELYKGNIKYKTIATILYNGIRGAMGDDAPSYQEVGNAMVEQGYTKLFSKESNNALARFLTVAITGKEKVDEEDTNPKKPEPQEKEDSTG